MIHEQHPPVAFDRPRDPRAALRASSDEVRFVDLPAQRMFSVEGTGAPAMRPSGMQWRRCIRSPTPSTLRRRGVVSPSLSGTLRGRTGPTIRAPLLDVPDDGGRSSAGFHWRLMLPVPPSARPAEIDSAIWEVAARKAPAALELLHVETLAEGRSAQTLHVEPGDAEAPNPGAARAAISDAGFVPRDGIMRST